MPILQPDITYERHQPKGHPQSVMQAAVVQIAKMKQKSLHHELLLPLVMDVIPFLLALLVRDFNMLGFMLVPLLGRVILPMWTVAPMSPVHASP